MAFLSFGKKKGEKVVIFDIGSSSVGCSFVDYNYSKEEGEHHPTVLFSKRIPIPFQKEMNFERFFALTLTTLDEVAGELERQRLGSPSKILCMLGAPWYVAQTRVITIKKEEPFVFSKHFADELIKKEVELFERLESKEFAELASGNLEFIENKTVQVKLNGYVARVPIGKKCQEAEITLFLGISPKDILAQVRSRLHRFFHRDVLFHTFLFASYTAIRHVFPTSSDYIIADIGGEITELSVVRNDIVEESHSFPLGKNLLLRGIARGMNKTPAEALSLLKMYTHGLSDETTTASVGKILGPVRAEWLEGLTNILGQLSKKFLLPEKIFITADRNIVQWFVQVLKEEDFHQFTFTHKKFDIIVLDPSTLLGFCSFKDDVEKDTFLMIETLFAEHLLAHTPLHI